MTDNTTTTTGPDEPIEVDALNQGADAALSDAVESVATVEGTTVPDNESDSADSEPAPSEPAPSEPANSEPAPSEPANSEPANSEIDDEPAPVEATIEVTGPPVDAEVQVIVEAGGTEDEAEPAPAAAPAPDASQAADAQPDATRPDAVDLETSVPDAVDPEPGAPDGTEQSVGVEASVTTKTGSSVEASAEVAPTPEVVPAPTETAETGTSSATPAPPKPSAVPRPPVPTPAALAKAAPHPPAVVAPPTITTDHSASAAFGRVDEQGVVYVRTPDGEEKEVGSYPGASSEQALTYFARKYDELFASAVLLDQRLGQPEVPSKDVQEGLKTLKAQTDDAAVVGDLDALASKLDEIQSGIAAKRVVEQQHRAEARAVAKVEREAIVAEAESIAGQPESRIQWKTSGARMRELLDDWKAHQRASTRLDRESETALWQRFSTARNGFDKARRTHFAGLDAAHSEAKSAKEHLVDEAEKLAASTDWAPTAGAFKRLMDEWRQAGRASRSDDDKLWMRFKAAQDSFFAAKDAVVAQEEEGFRGNLSVKQALLVEAQAILPVTDLEKAKGQLRAVQDKWDAAGKVPRADMERIEKALRRIEQTVRDAEDKRWKASNPEAAARAQAMVDQLERTVADLEADLTKAQASGNASKVKKATEALDARRAWLDQARAGVAEFGG
ncbi:MAG: DUF349 domain-containing protein [Terracoccus sp.]